MIWGSPLFGSGGPIPLTPFPRGERGIKIREAAPLFNSHPTVSEAIYSPPVSVTL